MTVIRDLVFSTVPGFRPVTLDLHVPRLLESGPAPLIVFVHGGGWRLGSRRSFGPNFTVESSFERIVDAGFAVASVDYRLSGEAHFPAQIDDVRTALAWLAEHGSEHGIDTSRTVLWGESAGATIASLVALGPSWEFDGVTIAGVIDWYGPSDLVALAEDAEPSALATSRESEWLGGTALDLPDVGRAASPLFAVHPDAPPFFIAHGLADEFVPHSQSEEFAEALRAFGVEVDFTSVPDANHMWNGIADPAPLLDAAIAFALRRTLSDAALLQQRLWSSDPEAWALYSEPHNRPLFEAVLDAAGVSSGTALLDVACGTGMVLQLAAERGAVVSGIDVSAAMLGIATDRLPDADLRLVDMQLLPFADNSFDAVTGVNAFQFALDPVAALGEAARVLRPGGRLAVGMFAEPERSQSTVVHEAMAVLSPPTRDGEHQPYALSAPGNLEAAFAAAGLVLADQGEVECVWAYDRVEDAVRGLRGSGGGTRAVEDVGTEAVGTAIEQALIPFTDGDGRVRMVNTFRWMVATK
jgi:acetyl esterase/lipase/2-polyprenyl-3-methyl-5-hydroxy-6-metoxy-1,4-benzoquinol methylase